MKFLLTIFLSAIIFSSCSTSGPSGMFGKKSPHEEYGDKIKSAGLYQTALGSKWFAAADKSLNAPLTVSLPYSETGYFPANEPKALGIKFNAKRGEKLTISLTKRPATGFALYLDVWTPSPQVNSKPKFILAGDTSNSVITLEVGKEENYILRIQPELLKGGEYTLSISKGPSLAFPVTPKVSSKVGSFWGVARDGGARKHEGIDIFAPKRTPLVASADGVVTRVNENELGGKVVFLVPYDKDYTLYYAHLDEQLVNPGQRVKQGEMVGLMGNTGNAKSTSPHLHFGIYTNSGAIDPLPFVDRNIKYPESVTASLKHIDNLVRSEKNARLYTEPSTKSFAHQPLETNTLMKVEAATKDWYKVILPGGESGFVQGSKVSGIYSPVKKINLKTQQGLLDEPSDMAARKARVSANQKYNLLGSYKDYLYIDTGLETGWIRQNADISSPLSSR